MPDGVEAGVYCARTEAAVERFQAERGLRRSGRCDAETWRAIVEASWKLGDRLLLHSAPNLRGDDVGDLQARLARLGFDSGRADGIFGPLTARALEDFQRNSGLYIDGVCGTDTVRALDVLGRQTGSGPGIAAVRELEALTASARTLADLRIVVGQFGGLSGLTRQLVQALRHRSATVMASDEPDPSSQAQAANRFAATVYLGFETEPDTSTTVCYFRVPEFESVGGRSLATELATQCGRSATIRPRVEGMRLPVLRETRMPAVLFSLGDAQTALDGSQTLVEAVIEALESWASAPDTGES